ncbi:hypothetical protein GOV04_03880 [Candidatus Woesearchaeota archaeon]|nr:hypothetical protein [Candidatus Woesearchaeota archaeon]
MKEQKDVIKIIKPHKVLVFSYLLLKISLFFLVIALAIPWINYLAGFDVVEFILTFSKDIPQPFFDQVGETIFHLTIPAVIVLLINYLMILREEYLFYEDHLTFEEGFIARVEQKIDYQNISRVYYEKTTKLLDLGRIIIELTGKENKIVLRYVDNLENSTAFINQLVNNAKDKK